MEPHVKERIVGAAVLVALGVWLIPWILDGPDDVVAESETLPEILLPAAEPIVPLRADNDATVRPPPDVVAASAQAGPEPVAAANPASTTRPPTESVQSPPPAASPPDRGGWLVQIGAFSEKANADQLANRVSTYGYDPYVTEFRSNGKMMYRVRISGFATENLADAAASSISAHSIKTQVISPE